MEDVKKPAKRSVKVKAPSGESVKKEPEKVIEKNPCDGCKYAFSKRGCISCVNKGVK